MMDNKSIEKFLRLFLNVGFNESQILKLSQQSWFTIQIDEMVESLHNDNPRYDALESIKSNLWELAKEDRELYFKKLIRDVYNATKKIAGNKTELFESEIPFEKYIYACWYNLDLFKEGLDIICADFSIDIFKIQEEIGMVVIEKRYISSLIHHGHNELFDIKNNALNGEEIKCYSLKAREALNAKKLSLDQIALIYAINQIVLSRENATSIVESYGHTSGDALYTRYSKFNSLTKRTSPPKEYTRQTLINKIDLFKSVEPYIFDQHKKSLIAQISSLEGHLTS